jgi:RimJ/RimL family protein N-acetyltransferase
MEKLLRLVNILRPCLPDEARPNLDRFLCLPSTVVYEVEPLRGVWVATNVRPGGIAEGHVSIPDRSLLGKPELGREAVATVFKNYKPHKIQTLIPKRNELSVKYALDIGFQLEGVLKQYLRYNNRWEDAVICGALLEDF